MVNIHRQHDASFKDKVALEALKGEKTVVQISSELKVHPKQIRQWRNHLLETLPDVFSTRRKTQEKEQEELEGELYRQIGQLKVGVEWLKKNRSRSCRDEAVRD